VRTTVGQLLVNEALPEKYRDYSRVVNKKAMTALLDRIAAEDPEKYKEVAHKLHQAGGYAAHTSGSTLRAEDMIAGPRVKKKMAELRIRIRDLVNDDTLTDYQREEALKSVTLGSTEDVENELYNEGVENNNTLAMQVHSGSRGKKSDMRAIMAGEFMVTDHRGKPIAMPILSSYAAGLRPHELWCLDADTEVRLANGGTVKIKDIRPGDAVLGADKSGNTFPVAVLTVFDNGDKECIECTFRLNRTRSTVKIVATPDHKILSTPDTRGSRFDLPSKVRLGDVATGLWRPVVSSGMCYNGIHEPRVPGIKGIKLGEALLGMPKARKITDSMYAVDSKSVGVRATFDIEVDHPDHLFVLANGLIVSNSGSYGTRKSQADTKLLVGNAGYFGKRIFQAAHGQVVTETDCGTENAIPVDAQDADNVGALLARDYDGMSAGTPITGEIMRKLGDRKIYVRSPITCHAHKGVCSKCMGLSEKGKLPDIGDPVGIVAAQSIAERVSQGALGCLAVGTLVRMADYSVKRIENIQIGDMVLGVSIDGKIEKTPVLHVFSSGRKPCCEYTFGGARLVATPDHKVLGRHGNDNTRILKVDDCRHAYGIVDDRYSGLWPLIVKKTYGTYDTYDIEIGTEDHLFLLASGLVVSNSKHGGGRADAKSMHPRLKGLPLLEQFIDMPANFQDAATLATLDGEVEHIEDAPQGGKFITIDGEDHYVNPGFDLKVKPGQQIVRGQQLSDGWVNPSETVGLQGLGAARLQLVRSYLDALKTTGVSANRRNLEVVAKGLLNHVRVTDFDGVDGLPEDVMEYGSIARTYRPRFGTHTVPARRGIGMYLEKPVLYHTIGTKVTKEMAGEFDEANVKDISVHSDRPSFEPIAVRSMESSMRSPDWQVRLGGSYLQRGLLEAAQRGRSSDLDSTSFIPAIMKGTEFGKNLRTAGSY
jgi:hypothetical protein